MRAYEFGVIDYVVSGIHLALLIGLLVGGIYLIYLDIKNQKVWGGNTQKSVVEIKRQVN